MMARSRPSPLAAALLFAAACLPPAHAWKPARPAAKPPAPKPGTAGGAAAGGVPAAGDKADPPLTETDLQKVFDSAISGYPAAKAQVHTLPGDRFVVVISGTLKKQEDVDALKANLSGLALDKVQVVFNLTTAPTPKGESPLRTVSDIWTLTFPFSDVANANDADTMSVAALKDALNAAFPVADKEAPVVSADRNALFLKGPQDTVLRVKSLLAMLDTASPQVQLDVFPIEVSGSSENVSKEMGVISKAIAGTQDQMKLVRLELSKVTPTSQAASTPGNRSWKLLEKLLTYVGFDRSASDPFTLVEGLAFLALSPNRQAMLDRLSNGISGPYDQWLQNVTGNPAAMRAAADMFPHLRAVLPGTAPDIEQDQAGVAHFLEGVRGMHELSLLLAQEGTPTGRRFTALSISDPVTLALEVLKGQGPAAYLRSLFPLGAATYNGLPAADPLPPASVNTLDELIYYTLPHSWTFPADRLDQLTDAVVRVLNAALFQYNLYTAGGFSSIDLPDDLVKSASALTAASPPNDIADVNRRLLEAAFPNYISLSRSGQMAARHMAPERLARESVVADGLLGELMQAFAADMEEMYLDPLMKSIQSTVGGGHSEGVTLSGKTRIVVTSRRSASLKPTMVSTINSASPSPFGKTFFDAVFPKGSDSSRSRDDAKDLSGAAKLVAGGPLAQAAVIEGLLESDTPALFTTVAPGVSVEVTPNVTSDGGTARLTLTTNFGVTATTEDKGSRDDTIRPQPADAIQSNTMTTGADVNGFDLFDISSFTIQTSHPQPPHHIPLLGRLPLFGPMFQFPRGDKRVTHASILLVNAAILPRTLGLFRFYGGQ